jgi:diguanylate cyclase (GGDEF)-like protein
MKRRDWGIVVSKYRPQSNRSHSIGIILIGLVVCLGFSAVFGAILWDMARRDRTKALDAATNLVATMANDISRNIELYDLSLQSVLEGLRVPEIEKVSPLVRHLVLFDRSATAKDLGSIQVIDRAGNVTIDSRFDTPPVVNYAKRGFFRIHAQRSDAGLYISRPWVASSGEYLVSLSRRIDNADGSFAGVVAGTMRLSYFHDLFRKVKLGPEDSLTLMRADGTLLMRLPFNIDSIGADLGGSTVFKSFPRLQEGWYQSLAVSDGVKRLFAYHQIGDQPMLVTNGLSVDAIYIGWRHDAWLIGSLIAFLCVINLALVIFLARELRRRGVAEQQLAVLATTDALTGLCNRRGFDEAIGREWSRCGRERDPVALLLVDVDHFKAYNDEYGHQLGDNVLKVIASTIAASVQRPCDVSARYGGEEFAVLLPGESIEGALHVAEQIRSNVLLLCADQVAGGSVPSVSVGAASMLPVADARPGDLVRFADAALYDAKRNGRNRVEAARISRLAAAE